MSSQYVSQSSSQSAERRCPATPNCNNPPITEKAGFCEYHHSLRANSLRRYREKHRQARLCANCARPARPGRTKCEFHAQSTVDQNKQRKAKEREDRAEIERRLRERAELQEIAQAALDYNTACQNAASGYYTSQLGSSSQPSGSDHSSNQGRETSQYYSFSTNAGYQGYNSYYTQGSSQGYDQRR